MVDKYKSTWRSKRRWNLPFWCSKYRYGDVLTRRIQMRAKKWPWRDKAGLLQVPWEHICVSSKQQWWRYQSIPHQSLCLDWRRRPPHTWRLTWLVPTWCKHACTRSCYRRYTRNSLLICGRKHYMTTLLLISNVKTNRVFLSYLKRTKWFKHKFKHLWSFKKS